MDKKRRTKEECIEIAQIAIECHGKSYREAGKLAGVSASTIKNWVNKYGWVAGKTARIADNAAHKKIELEQDLNEKTSHLSARHSKEVYSRADKTYKALSQFEDDITWSQGVARGLMDELVAGNKVELGHIDAFSKVSTRNKKAVCGEVKQMDEEQNSGDDVAISILEHVKNGIAKSGN